MTDDVRVAYHEAGHAVACWLLGGRITGPLSIVPALNWRGIAHIRAAASRNDMDTLGHALEASVTMSLAGVQAERYARAAGFAPALPRRLRTAPPPLTAEDAHLLAAGDDPGEPSPPTDVERAFEVCEMLIGPGPAAYQLALRLEREAARL